MIIVTNTNTSALILPDPNGSGDMSGEALDIRDIKGVVDVPSGNEWVFFIFALFGVAIVVFISIWIRQNKKII